MSQPTHYEILSLSPPPSAHTPQDLKSAYRRALLLNHPDKVDKAPKPASSHPTYSVDQISASYTTLSSPSLKAEYDRSLLLFNLNSNANLQQNGLNGKMGTAFAEEKERGELLDLDELEYNEGEQAWYRGCRCGNERGYVVREEELEEMVELGEREVRVGCGGCSLWVRVAFEVGEG